MKKLIRLTESELRNIIKESVKNIIKESYGYDDYDNDEFENVRDKFEQVKSGAYDKKIQELYKEGYKNVEDIIDNLFYEYDPDYDDKMYRLIKDKLKLWFKDYAMKSYDSWDHGYNKYPYDADAVFNMKDIEKSNDMDKFVKDDENLRNNEKFPEFVRKDGKLRKEKQILKNITNRKNMTGAQLAADKGPLHRKGSLNRELD